MNERKMKKLGAMLQLMTGMNQAFGPDYEGQKLDLGRQELDARVQGQEMDNRYREWLMSPENPDARRVQAELDRMALMDPVMLEQERLQNLALQQNAALNFGQDFFQPDVSLASPTEAARQKAAFAQKIFDLVRLPFTPQAFTETNINNLPR